MALAVLRDISVVIIAIEVFIILLAPTVAVYLVLRGMTWVLGRARRYAPVVQGYFRQGAQITDQASQKVAAPVIAVEAFAARVRRMRSVL